MSIISSSFSIFTCIKLSVPFQIIIMGNSEDPNANATMESLKDTFKVKLVFESHDCVCKSYSFQLSYSFCTISCTSQLKYMQDRNIRYIKHYDEAVSHLLLAGSDIILCPSFDDPILQMPVCQPLNHICSNNLPTYCWPL